MQRDESMGLTCRVSIALHSGLGVGRVEGDKQTLLRIHRLVLVLVGSPVPCFAHSPHASLPGGGSQLCFSY